MREALPREAQLSLWPSDGSATDWAVREAPRARRLTVRVFHSGRVEVVVPRRTSRRAITTFLERHRDWIDRKLTEARLRAVPPEPFPPSRIELAALGTSWRVHVAGGAGRPRVRALAAGFLSVSGDTSNVAASRGALRSWLVEVATQAFAPQLEQLARELGMRYSRLAIRRQRSRWGSCSARGTISLNCCLLFQRPQVVRYLLIHELAHTRHLNHSRRFWECVALLCPQFESLDRELSAGWQQVPGWVFAD